MHVGGLFWSGGPENGWGDLQCERPRGGRGAETLTGCFVVLILQRRASAVAVSELSVAVPGQVTPFESDN